MSDSDGCIFTQPAATRISNAVKTVEGSPRDMTDVSTATQRQLRTSGFVTITGTLAGGGNYTGQINIPTKTDISASADAAAGNFGEPHDPEYGQVYVSNAPEIGKTTHAIENGRVCRYEIIRRQTDGTVWVGIESYAFEDCDT